MINVSFLLFSTLLLVGAYYVWWNYLPTRGQVLALATDHHARLRNVDPSKVTCEFLEPLRLEEQQYGRFWIGCGDTQTTPDGSLWIYSWLGHEDGRALSSPVRPTDIEGSDRWNR